MRLPFRTFWPLLISLFVVVGSWCWILWAPRQPPSMTAIVLTTIATALLFATAAIVARHMRDWQRVQESASHPAPENVRLVRDDGHVIPLECVYNRTQDGIAEWVTVTPLNIDDCRRSKLTVDVMPARTVINVRLARHGR